MYNNAVTIDRYFWKREGIGMKIIEAILGPSKVDAVKGALVKLGVRGLTVLEGNGFGDKKRGA